MIVRFDRRAGADQRAVAVRVVDASDRWPELVRAKRLQRIHRLLARVFVRPGIADDRLRRVRRVLQHVIILVCFARRDLFDLFVDRKHRIAEAVQLLRRFALGRFDHERAGNRE